MKLRFPDSCDLWDGPHPQNTKSSQRWRQWHVNVDGGMLPSLPWSLGGTMMMIPMCHDWCIFFLTMYCMALCFETQTFVNTLPAKSILVLLVWRRLPRTCRLMIWRVLAPLTILRSLSPPLEHLGLVSLWWDLMCQQQLLLVPLVPLPDLTGYLPNWRSSRLVRN